MRIAVASDVHLEFGDIRFSNRGKADLLILAGDIAVGAIFKDFLGFFEACSKKFKDIIYILGNHEHYHGDIGTTLPIIKKHLSHLPNIHVVENEVMVFGDTVFLAGTLWTSMNGCDPLTMAGIKSCMNDFRIISNLIRPFSPLDSVKKYQETVSFLEKSVKEHTGKKIVVITHHAPSFASVNDKYKAEFIMNGGFASDLSEFILDNPQITLWIHGHMHDPVEYTLGNTKILSNPRGYAKYEPEAANFHLKFMEI